MRATAAHGNTGRDRGPLPGARFDLHRAAEQRHTLPHPLQTDASASSRGGSRRPGRVDPDSIILHAQLDRHLVSHQANADAPGVGVLRDVGQRFLQHAVYGVLDQRQDWLRIESLDPRVLGDALESREFLHVAGHRDREPQIVQDSRVEPSGQASHVAQGPGGRLPESLRQLRRVRDRLGLLDRPQPDQQGRQRLPGLVVKLTGEPAPLLVLGGHHLLEQPGAESLLALPLGHILDHADHAAQVPAFRQPQRSEGHHDRHQRSVLRAEGGVALRGIQAPGLDQGVERRLIGRRHEFP